ncbi:MAG: hypothetical protein KF726_21970 [Anaerolineae bacterium]|nr:hypothetical protein [Anaerolineae bacterium]
MLLKRYFFLLLLILLTSCEGLNPPATVEVVYITATPLPTDTPIASETPVIGGAATPDLTLAAVVATWTPNPALAQISTLPTSTPTPPASKQPTLTPSFTITFTDSPAPTTDALQPSACVVPAAGGFAAIFTRDTAIQAALGCPISGAFAINSATQDFENGRMVWISQFADVPAEVIYAVFNNGAYGRYDDTWVEGVDPLSGGEAAPAGLTEPIRGFGKVWRANPAVRSTLGWARSAEAGTTAQIQRFERGEMVFIASLGQTIIFVGGTSWRAETTPF